MSSIRYISTTPPAVNLGSRSWTARAREHAGIVGWWTLRDGRATMDTSGAQPRVSAMAPRVGTPNLVRSPGALGPQLAAYEGMSGAAFTNGELNGLQCAVQVPRDDYAMVVIAWNGASEPAQNRILAAAYATGDNMKLWRLGGTGQMSWRNGSVEAATTEGSWRNAGPMMLIGERAGTTMRLRGRDRTRTGNVATGTLSPSSIAANVTMVLGQDEINDGHAAANPNASQSWGGGIMEAALYRGSILNTPALLAFWDSYFQSVYAPI